MIELAILTVIIEICVLLILKERDITFLAYWAAVTALTNILANLYVIYAFNGGSIEYAITTVVIESAVFLTELLLAFLYTSSIRKSLLYSGACNLSSFLIGLLIQIIII